MHMKKNPFFLQGERDFFCKKVVFSLRFFDDYIEHSCSHQKIPFPMHMHRRTRLYFRRGPLCQNNIRMKTRLHATAYDLQGRPVRAGYRGISIQNGND